jgi:hypothetical protein
MTRARGPRGSAAPPRSIIAHQPVTPGHRRKIHAPAFRDIAIGVAGGSVGRSGSRATRFAQAALKTKIDQTPSAT